MRCLVADKFSEGHLKALEALGLEVEYAPGLGAAKLAEKLAGVHVLVVRSTEVRKVAIEAGKALSLIVRAGAGVNTIDVAAASAHGIFVANCPGKNSAAVAELAFGHLVSLDRRLVEQDRDLKAGRWRKGEYGKAQGLAGRTLGLVGFGSIARETAQRARGFGMRVIAWSRSLTDETAKAHGVERVADLAALAARADAVSVHVALAKETRGLIGGDFFAALKKGSLFVNTARAEVVDRAALEGAIAKGIRVAVDVFHAEPEGGEGTFDDPLGKLPGLYGSHHVGASTEQAQAAIADETVRIVGRFLASGEVPNCVNVARRSRARFQLVVRHEDKVGVLAGVLAVVREAGVNAQEIENTIFEGASAACAKIRLDDALPPERLEEIRKRPEVIFADLWPLPG